MVWNVVKRSAPQLIGFGIGFGSFAYIERYGGSPPEMVAENTVLLSAHNGLLSAKKAFQGLWGSVDTTGKAVQDSAELFESARAAFADSNFEECGSVLNQIFVESMTLNIHSVIPHLEWLPDATAALHSKRILTDRQAIIAFNWLCKAGGSGRLIDAYPEKTVDLPLKMLKEEGASHSDKLLCCCLLTHATGWRAQELPERRENKGWFSRTPRNEVAEKIMKEEAAMKAMVECLVSGLKFPADVAIFAIDSDEKHAKTLREAGLMDALTTVIAQYSTIGKADSKQIQSGTEYGGSFLHALSSLGGIQHTSLDDDDDASAYLNFTDAVFLLTASNPADPEAVVYGLETLRGLLDTGKVPMEFLAKKGVVGMAAQSLQQLGGMPKLVDYINAFVFPFITENAVKENVSDDEIRVLAQTLHALATDGEDVEMADAALEGILSPEPEAGADQQE